MDARIRGAILVAALALTSCHGAAEPARDARVDCVTPIGPAAACVAQASKDPATFSPTLGTCLQRVSATELVAAFDLRDPRPAVVDRIGVVASGLLVDRLRGGELAATRTALAELVRTHDLDSALAVLTPLWGVTTEDGTTLAFPLAGDRPALRERIWDAFVADRTGKRLAVGAFLRTYIGELATELEASIDHSLGTGQPPDPRMLALFARIESGSGVRNDAADVRLAGWAAQTAGTPLLALIERVELARMTDAMPVATRTRLQAFVLASLRDPSAAARAIALEALPEFGRAAFDDAAIRRTMHALVASPIEAERSAALRYFEAGLRAKADAQVVAAELERLVDDPSPSIRSTARDYLAEIRPGSNRADLLATVNGLPAPAAMTSNELEQAIQLFERLGWMTDASVRRRPSRPSMCLMGVADREMIAAQDLTAFGMDRDSANRRVDQAITAVSDRFANRDPAESAKLDAQDAEVVRWQRAKVTAVLAQHHRELAP